MSELCRMIDAVIRGTRTGIFLLAYWVGLAGCQDATPTQNAEQGETEQLGISRVLGVDDTEGFAVAKHPR